MYFVYVVGTAGSGKTSFVKAFAEWIEDHEMSSAIVNLDPAIEVLPYVPAVDVRDYVNYWKILEEGLGPNGALIKSVDMMLAYAERMRRQVEETESNYILVDTPGQLELFAFRRSTLELVRILTANDKMVIIYLIDPSLFVMERGERRLDAYSFVSALLLGVSIKARFKSPMVFAISKADLLLDSDIEMIEMWMNDLGSLASLVAEGEEMGLVSRLVEAIEEAGGLGELVFVSSLTERGLDDIYACVQRVLAGGEDYATEEPSARL